MVSLFPIAYMAGHQLIVPVILLSLFFRGAGLGCINVPSMSAAYATIPHDQLPMATTTLNIAQRLGGPMLTTIVSFFLAWRMRTVSLPSYSIQAFAITFWFLSFLHALNVLFAFSLPKFVNHQHIAVEGVEVLE
jgi:hypothetical protein